MRQISTKLTEMGSLKVLICAFGFWVIGVLDDVTSAIFDLYKCSNATESVFFSDYFIIDHLNSR